VENSQVRMMSWPCGRRSMGNTASNTGLPPTQSPAICGVSEEVAHVSMTSASPMNPPGAPRCDSTKPSGTSVLGSMGRRDSSTTIGRSHSGCPAASSGYHSGIGTPNQRWRLTSQSPLRPPTQFA